MIEPNPIIVISCRERTQHENYDERIAEDAAARPENLSFAICTVALGLAEPRTRQRWALALIKLGPPAQLRQRCCRGGNASAKAVITWFCWCPRGDLPVASIAEGRRCVFCGLFPIW